MSLSHPNTPISQQDLHDFYNKIKPYMGSYPSAIVSKFKKSDLYSTDERVIGQWTDGKPLYQKVVTATLGASSTTIDVSSLDIGTFCFSKGMINNGSSMIPIPYVNDTMYYMAVNYYSIANDTIIIVSKNMEGATVHIAIQYTKTTDSAISIGEATDYSTTEKIVGTWIDGSPVYQRTYNVTSPTSPNTDTVIISLPSTYSIKNMFGFISQDGGCFPINFAYDASGNYAHTYYREGIHMKVGGSYNDKPCSITIQYTKTI